MAVQSFPYIDFNQIHERNVRTKLANHVAAEHNWLASGWRMHRFIVRENIKHYRRELENGVDEPTRATMLRLLVEEEDQLGHTREQLAKLDHHISRLGQIMARHVDLMDNLGSLGRPLERAPMVLATYNDLMATYLACWTRWQGA